MSGFCSRVTPGNTHFMSLVTCFALFVTVNLLLVELSCDGCSALKDVEDDDAEAPKRHVPFVNRPFESEIHGTVNFTYFCCVLLVTWCYRVLLSCYLRPK